MKTMEWIKVEDRLPEYSERVLLCKNYEGRPVVFIGTRYCTDANGQRFIEENGVEVKRPVTHWMPLPEPPK